MLDDITWLHVSDLHFCESRTGWDSSRVLDTLITDLSTLEQRYNLHPDLLFVTGDLVFGHHAPTAGDTITDQFKGAARFLERVRTTFRPEIRRENVFIVPGNHDVNREYVSDDQIAWLDSVRDAEVVVSLIHNKPLQWRRYVERLQDYKNFLTHNYPHLLTDPDRIIYTVQRTIRTLKVNIIGLNSAWSCCRDNEKGKLWMGARWQISHLLNVSPPSDINIALVHHPSNWLVEYEDPQFSRQLERDFSFSLHGHEHQEWVQQNRHHIRIAAGACYDGSEKANGYNFVHLNLSERTGEVWLRRYHSVGGAWVPENIPHRTDNEGRWKLGPIYKMAAEFHVHSQHAVSDEGWIPIGHQRPSFKRYGSDLRPVVDAWVGREKELALLRQMERGVVAISGIGGQGKSALVAKHLEGWIEQNPESFWDWRDCREEGERFFTQLISLIEHFTAGLVTGEHLAEADTRAVVRYFFELAGERTGIIVLDNVDSYVSQTDEKLNLGVNILVEEALRVPHNLLFILTCRPRVSYASPRFLEIALKGIGLQETFNLFQLRGVTAKETSEDEIEEIWERTEGHPLWLNLIAVQMSRNPQTAPDILQELRKGHVDDRTRSMFRALWRGLNTRQQMILRCMVEVSYPETADSIKDFMGSLLKSRNQFIRAFEGLKSLNLVVERGSTQLESRFDLHPLVRNFIRTEYSKRQDRLPYIQPILLFLARIIQDSSEPSENAVLEDLQRWTTIAELELAAGNSNRALETLSRSADKLIAKGFHEEFLRVARIVIEQLDWQDIETQDSSEFHDLIDNVIKTLAEHDREEEAREYLIRYQGAAGSRTAPQLKYLKLACYFEWLLGNYSQAIKLGREGLELKLQSGIDTDSDISHELGLALRDHGDWDEAMKVFAPDQTVEDILSEDYNASGKSASFYGNLGRCLQFKGDLKNALTFYVISARILEKSFGSIDVLNQGYAAFWIGEVLEKLGNVTDAYKFFRRCRSIWSWRAPLLVATAQQKLDNIEVRTNEQVIQSDDKTINEQCKIWIQSWRSPLLKY